MVLTGLQGGLLSHYIQLEKCTEEAHTGIHAIAVVPPGVQFWEFGGSSLSGSMIPPVSETVPDTY